MMSSYNAFSTMFRIPEDQEVENDDPEGPLETERPPSAAEIAAADRQLQILEQLRAMEKSDEAKRLRPERRDAKAVSQVDGDSAESSIGDEGDEGWGDEEDDAGAKLLTALDKKFMGDALTSPSRRRRQTMGTKMAPKSTAERKANARNTNAAKENAQPNVAAPECWSLPVVKTAKVPVSAKVAISPSKALKLKKQLDLARSLYQDLNPTYRSSSLEMDYDVCSTGCVYADSHEERDHVEELPAWFPSCHACTVA
ncbi:hypothetical protein M885DRAFT_533285 [Pelagophyceae sp. CCMP2097]|nr:hypothetical protein M885DRAFT_533285 [Pelagophyceae sp. CCMP2097]